jgi:hypothetical protein
MKKIFTTFGFVCVIVCSANAQWASFPQYENNRITIGDIAITGSTITVEALITMQDYLPVLNAYDIVSKHYGPPDVSYLFRPNDFAIQTDAGLKNVSHDIPLCFDSTYHVAGTYDGDSIRYFINAVQVASAGWSGNLYQNSLTTSIGNVSPDPIDYYEQFVGYLDEVRIWSTARSANELLANMYDLPNPSSQTGLVAYYKFDGSYENVQGNSAYDGVPSGPSLANTNNPFYSGNFSESFCFPVSVEEQSNEKQGFSVYPNPASSVVNIINHNIAFTTVDMVLLNMVGEVVLSEKRSFSTYSLDMEQLSAGVYFLTLKNGDVSHILKVVKE